MFSNNLLNNVDKYVSRFIGFSSLIRSFKGSTSGNNSIGNFLINSIIVSGCQVAVISSFKPRIRIGSSKWKPTLASSASISSKALLINSR